MVDLLGEMIRQYRLLDYIGKGGHGTVYKAHDLELDRYAALKIMLAKHGSDQALIQRLHQEAEIIRDLRHPNIVPLIETWDDELGVCLAMPWIDGGDLRDHLAVKEQLSLQELSALLTQICGALDAAHAAQIIHRDIKPENILLDSNGKAYLTDFGFAKRKVRSSFKTTAGAIIGSPNYLSPEQIMGAEVSNRTDVFVLGILIYESLAGEHPFSEVNSRIKMMIKLANSDLPKLERPDITGEQLEQINAIIARCTARTEDQRYLTASSVAYHFAQIVENHPETP